MKVHKALKLKQQLVSEILDLQKRLSYNSMADGDVRPYSVKEAISLIKDKTLQLVKLKSAIHKANLEVYDKIFLLSELKGLVKKYSSIPTSTASQVRGQILVKYITEISQVEKDEMVAKIQEQINQIQDELDTHNASKDVVIE